MKARSDRIKDVMDELAHMQSLVESRISFNNALPIEFLWGTNTTKILDLMGSIVTVLNLDGKILFINKAGCKALAIKKRDDFFGRDFCDSFIPAGLRGEEIPLGARVIAVADVYQALISNRPYRNAFVRRKTLDIIRDESGSHFDPCVVGAFLKIAGKKERF